MLRQGLEFRARVQGRISFECRQRARSQLSDLSFTRLAKVGLGLGFRLAWTDTHTHTHSGKLLCCAAPSGCQTADVAKAAPHNFTLLAFFHLTLDRLPDQASTNHETPEQA